MDSSAGNTYRNLAIGGQARTVLGNINGPVTVTGKLIQINPNLGRVQWRAAERRRREHPDGEPRQPSPANGVPISTLADYFLTSVQRLDAVQLLQPQVGRFLVLETLLYNLSGRLTAWGCACGLHDPQAYDNRLDAHPRIADVTRTLRVIAEQVAEGSLTSEYGLSRYPSQQVTSRLRFWNSGPANTNGIDIDPSMSQIPKSDSGRQWNILDESKFDKLLTCLRQFIEDLERFTRDIDISEQQRHYLDAGVESITDIDVLTRMENARVGRDDPVSDAASVRRLRLLDDSATRASLLSTDQHQADDASSTNGTFVTAPSRQQGLAVVSENYEDETVATVPAAAAQNPQAPAQRVLTIRPSPRPFLNTDHFSAEEIEAQKAKFLSIKAGDIEIVQDELRAEPYRSELRGTWNGRKRILLDLKRFHDGDPRLTATIRTINDNLRDVLGVFLGPEGTPYEGGIFFTRWAMVHDYPLKPPIVKFLTRVYHPNIDARGRVCMDHLANEYSPVSSLRTLLLTLSSILDDPNVDEPLVPEIARQYQEDREQYNRLARAYTKRYASGTTCELPPDSTGAPWWEGMKVEEG